MKFEEAYEDWRRESSDPRKDALAEVCRQHTCRHRLARCEEDGLEGLQDKRISQVSHHQTPMDRGVKLMVLCLRRHDV